MPPITYSNNDMLDFSAAFGSFHVKSSSTSFVNFFDDGLRFAVHLNCHFPSLDHLDGVLLERPLVNRPQVLVDADFAHQAFIESFGGAHCFLCVGWLFGSERL